MDDAIPSAATQRLIAYLANNGGYEYDTSMLWVNVLNEAFPLNHADSWLYAPEFSHKTGRCDLVTSQSTADETWPKHFQATGLPFIAVEFKSPSVKAGDSDWEKAYQQMTNTMNNIIDSGLYEAQTVYGVVAAGTKCALYFWDGSETNRGFVSIHPEAKMKNLEVPTERAYIMTQLEAMKITSPASSQLFLEK
ncbi:hypothetical protein FBEOM_7180 [Fusarium beomiforme]|uniref:Uncharacterized protein n=1 Tax=Fusarium beomiforme TaxID=44412 RepID=A0A9P5AJC0_9HYPO|nr:hypothetical protein FBEOM_7180 [Fusarium beomiforme]